MIGRALLVAVCAVAASAASAAAGEVTAVVAPSTVEVARTHPTAIHLIVDNGASRALRRITIKRLAAGARGLRVAIDNAARTSVPPGSAAQYVIRVRATAPVLFDRKVSLLVRYRTGRRRAWAEATFTVTPPVQVDPADIATMQVRASLGAMRSGRSAPMHVLITNKTAEPLSAGPIALDLPSSFSSSRTAAFEVPPHATAAVAVKLSAQSRVQPGAHQIVVTAPVQVTGEGPRFDLVETTEATVGVEGEGALLSILGVPALFLLPGVFFLGGPLLLRRLGVLHRGDRTTPALEPMSVQFAALSVIASLIIVGAWSLVGANLFDFYGLDDIIWVAVVSAAAGIVGYLLLAGPRFWWLSRKTPKSSDDPLAVLRKLDRQGLEVYVSRYGLPSGEAFMLQRADAARPETWFSPAIEVTWISDDAELYERVAGARDRTRDPGELEQLLKQAIKDRKLSLGWADQRGAHPVKRAEIDDAVRTVDAILQYADT
jgi:hypothetical protein